MKATWNETVIAESDDTVIVEGNHYFPQENIKKEFFEESRSGGVLVSHFLKLGLKFYVHRKKHSDKH